MPDEPPVKRRKMAIPPVIEEEPRGEPHNDELVQQEVDWGMDWGIGRSSSIALLGYTPPKIRTIRE